MWIWLMIMYDYVMYAVCNFVPYYRACYCVSVITDWFDIWINISIESSLLAYEMCQVILLMLCSIVWYVYCFLNTVLIGFDRYRCVLDRIFPFSKLPEYRRRFHFENTVPLSFSMKKYESENGGVFRRLFSSLMLSATYPNDVRSVQKACQSRKHCLSAPTSHWHFLFTLRPYYDTGFFSIYYHTVNITK